MLAEGPLLHRGLSENSARCLQQGALTHELSAGFSTSTYASTYTSTYTYTFAYTYIYRCMYLHLPLYICTHVHLYVCIYVYMHICIYVYMYVCMHICIYVYMYVCMYVCIYVYMYICICIYTYISMFTCVYLRCMCPRTERTATRSPVQLIEPGVRAVLLSYASQRYSFWALDPFRRSRWYLNLLGNLHMTPNLLLAMGGPVLRVHSSRKCLCSIQQTGMQGRRRNTIAW